MLGHGRAGQPSARLQVRTEDPQGCIMDSVAPFLAVAERRVVGVDTCLAEPHLVVNK